MGNRALSTGSSDETNDPRPIRWGIISAGKISSDYAKAIQFTSGAEVCLGDVFVCLVSWDDLRWPCIWAHACASVGLVDFLSLG